MKVDRPIYLMDALWRLVEAASSGREAWYLKTGTMMFRAVLNEWGNPKRSDQEIEEQLRLGIITLSPEIQDAMQELFPEREPSEFVLGLLAPAGYSASVYCTKCTRPVVGKKRPGHEEIVVVCVECLRTVGIGFKVSNETEPKAKA